MNVLDSEIAALAEKIRNHAGALEAFLKMWMMMKPDQFELRAFYLSSLQSEAMINAIIGILVLKKICTTKEYLIEYEKQLAVQNVILNEQMNMPPGMHFKP